MASSLGAPFAYLGGDYPGAARDMRRDTAPARAAPSTSRSPRGPARRWRRSRNSVQQRRAGDRRNARPGTRAAASRVAARSPTFRLAFYDSAASRRTRRRSPSAPTALRFDDDASSTSPTRARRQRPAGRWDAVRPVRVRGTLPGAGGSCAGALAPGDACTVAVSFAPSGAVAERLYRDAVGQLRRRHRPRQRHPSALGQQHERARLVVQDFDVTNLVAAAWDFGTRGLNQSTTRRVLRHQHGRLARDRDGRAGNRRRLRLRRRGASRPGRHLLDVARRGRVVPRRRRVPPRRRPARATCASTTRTAAPHPTPRRASSAASAPPSASSRNRREAARSGEPDRRLRRRRPRQQQRARVHHPQHRR